MRGNYAIFGMGVFGAKLAKELCDDGHNVVAVDINQDRIEDYRDKVTEAICADVRSEDVIRELDVKKFDAVILCMSSHFEDQILALTFLKQYGVRAVFVKANTAIQSQILSRLGADMILQPEQHMAELLARRLTWSNIADLFEFRGSAIAEVKVPADMAGKSLRQLDLRNRSHITVLLIRKANGKDEDNWSPDTVLEPKDTLTVFGPKQAIIDQFKKK